MLKLFRDIIKEKEKRQIMGEILEFNIGCRRCENLVQIGKNTFMCKERCHMDDSDIIPIEDGKITDDWYACNGDDYKRLSSIKSKTS